jgi:chromosome partitioning protein
MTKTITFAHHKGGTGKTTSCISVAGFLAKAGNRVLVVDLDPQGNATAGLGISKKSGHTMYHVMEGKTAMVNIVYGTNHEDIHVAPANQQLMKADLRVYKSKKDARILKNALAEIKDYYDYILIDSPPSNAHFLVNSLVASDGVALVADTGVFAVEGIEGLNKFIKEANKRYGCKIKVDNVLLTRCKRPFFVTNKPTKEIKKELQEIYGDRLHLVPYSDLIYETHMEGIPISHYKPKSKVGKAYQKIAESLW